MCRQTLVSDTLNTCVCHDRSKCLTRWTPVFNILKRKYLTAQVRLLCFLGKKSGSERGFPK